MPTNGEEFDELLNAYLDGELDAVEIASVEAMLKSGPEVGLRLEEIKGLRELTRVALQRQPATSVSLAERVLAEARRRAAAEGLPQSHFVLRQSKPVELSAVLPSRRAGGSWRTAGVLGSVALAATVLLAVFLPKLLTQQSMNATSLGGNELVVASPESKNDESTRELEKTEQAESGKIRYVGDGGFQVSLALIFDLQPTREAYERGIVGDILRQNGIPLSSPVVATPEINKAVEDALMLPNENASLAAGEAQILFVYADDQAIGKVTESLYRDTTNFPVAAMNVAFDAPSTGLLESIARATGNRFALNDSFSVGVEIPNSPFRGISKQGMLVSSSDRVNGSGLEGMMMRSGENSCLLLIVRVPE